MRAWYAEQQVPEVGERLLRKAVSEVDDDRVRVVRVWRGKRLLNLS